MRPNIRIMIFLAASVFSLEARAAEICGNGLDDDANNLVDEGCYSSLTTGQCESPLSCGDTGDVSPKLGSLRYSLPPDVSPDVPWGPGIGFRRFFQSMYSPAGGAPAYRTSLGPRWGHTYATWIDAYTSPTRVILHTTRGQDVFLSKTSSDATWEYFTPQPGFHYKEFKRRLASPFDYEIKLLTGESLNYDSAGRLRKIRDRLQTPNEVGLTYDGNGQVSTVTDASLKRRLLFGYTGGVMTSIAFQINGGSWTTYQTTSYGYTSGNLTTVTAGSTLIQTNNYTSNYLTSIQDHDGKTLVSFAYDSATAGKVVRVDTPRGVVGYEFASGRSNCSGKTVLYFHKANTTSCNVDADCGTGHLCGGKTGAGSTGQCFRGARCLTVSSPSEDVITAVSAFAGNSETCDGACLDAIDHVWDTASGKLDLTAVKDPSNNYTTKEFNANGLPTRIVYGDADSTPGGGTREMFLLYGETEYPGVVTEVRRKSDLQAGTCNDSITTACTRTTYSYRNPAGVPVGKPATVIAAGWTRNASDAVVSFSYNTTSSYDSKGRLTQIDGPLSGANDVTQFEYWSAPSEPFKDGFLQNFKRKKDATNFLTQSSLTFDFWGNATSISDVDGKISCQSFDSTRNYLTQRREQMAGQTDCTPNAADLVTSYDRDSALRLTKLTRPDGSCMIYEYDSRGRLSKTKRRDDCNAVSSGDTQEFTYSDEGLLVKTELKDAAGTVKKRQELTYFDSRRLEKMINPVNTAKWTGLVWETRGLLDNVAAVDGASNLSKTQWTYNAEGRVATEKRYTAGSAFDTWTLLFGWLGEQAQVTDGDSKATTSNVDDLGRLVRLTSPDFLPSIRVYDAANRLVTLVEGFGGSAPKTHSFSFDNVGRMLVGDYTEGSCSDGWGGWFEVPDIVSTYDTIPAGVTCPFGAGACDRPGRLVYVKARLMCGPQLDGGLDGDYTIEQETFYQYDDAGRVTREYIQDDAVAPPNSRTADHLYVWTKNGALAQTTLPSGAILGATYGTATSNSDTDRITALWRTNTSTPIIDQVLYAPYGPVTQYTQKNSPGTGFLQTRIAYNLAYRQTLNIVEKTDGTNIQSSVTLTEDAKGRVTARDYFPSNPTIASRYDSHYQYDLQDRVVCENTDGAATCPTSGSTLKNYHFNSPPFRAPGDWSGLDRPIPGSSGVGHTFTLASGTHRISGVAQSDGSPQFGNTVIAYNDLGSRVSDNNNVSLTNDGRSYTYDGRRNLVNVQGGYFTSGVWHTYSVASAFDAKNRRVFKSFYDWSTAKTATWFFYYDALDRLTEIKYTPDTAAPSTYGMFQLVWLGHKLVLYWQTDYPSVTTSKRYVSTDEMNRPVDMMSWPASGAAARVWTINPDAWGNDTVLVGSSVFQPILFAGQYKDDETIAWQNDGVTRHRPGVVLNGFRTYDPWTGSYLQVDPLVDSTWSSYVYVDSDPVGKSDRHGLKWGDGIGEIIEVEGFNACWDPMEGASHCVGADGGSWGTRDPVWDPDRPRAPGGGGGDWNPKGPPKAPPTPKRPPPDEIDAEFLDEVGLPSELDCSSCKAGCEAILHLRQYLCIHTGMPGLSRSCIDARGRLIPGPCVGNCIDLARSEFASCISECDITRGCSRSGP